ncbi:MAG: hypothetical protein GYB65_03700 [Chloroflexi bacterium]|nr:hypothetical protein [Chloroflexota bacterium]
MNIRQRWWAVLVVGLALLSIMPGGAQAQSDPGAGQAWLAFAIDGDIYILNPDSGALRRITTGDRIDTQPNWSPDGEWIVFAAVAYDGKQIFRVRTDGSLVQPLTGTEFRQVWDPVYSPDGEWITFTGVDLGRNPSLGHTSMDIYRMRPDGTDREAIVTTIGHDQYPVWWSPDSAQIAFFSDQGGQWALYRSWADGSRRERITDLTPIYSRPVLFPWSPDGEWIAFDSELNAAYNRDIYRVRAMGSVPQRLTDGPGTDQYPAWSPDGNWIAYLSSTPGRGIAGIYRVSANGSHVQQLVELPGSIIFPPSWSPDGAWIAFITYLQPPGAVSVYRVRPWGGEIEELATFRIENTGLLNTYRDGPQWSSLLGPNSGPNAPVAEWLQP